MPSTTALQRVAQIVDKFGDKSNFRYTCGVVPGIRENICFEPLGVVEAAVKSSGLENDAKNRPIQLAQSVDGAKFSKHLIFVMFSVKNQDLHSQDRETNNLVAAKNVQSCHTVWPIDIVIGKEKSDLVQMQLKSLFRKFGEACTSGVESKFGWQHIKVVTNTNLSAIWKYQQFGGAFKKQDNACHCCAVHKTEISEPRLKIDDCRWCNLLGHIHRPGSKCNHHPIETENAICQMEESVSHYEEQLQIMIDEMDDIRNNSLIHCNENPRKVIPSRAAENNPKSIHFSLERRGRRVLVEYNNRINHNLELCGKDSSNGLLKERQEKLRSHLT